MGEKQEMKKGEDLLEKANASTESNPDEAEKLYRRIIDGADVELGEDESKIQEQAINGLISLLVKQEKAESLCDLSKNLRPFFTKIPKAKTAKIVRTLIDSVAKIPNTSDLQVALCKETIEWCRQEKRTFLRQRIEGRLAALYLSGKRFTESMSIINQLLREVKKLDDKAHLLEIQLIESRVYHALRNLPKARAALTSARTTANAIYVPPYLQGEIDMQAGIISAEEKDYKTAYSYFYEAFEGFTSLDDPRAVRNLKYMLLCKIMTSNSEDVTGILNGHIALKYTGREVDAMKAVAAAHTSRSLKEFEKCLKEYEHELSGDPIVHAHLSALYDTLLEQNLLRLIEPFSRVEISHVAERINLDVTTIEAKLSQLVLDKKLNGILDQSAGCLIIFDDVALGKTYERSLETLSHMDRVVDALFEKAAALR
mmetsp:Transcript_10959/g.33617  ORF Transcript_10959/g.33617 Transcript_10959/m.33617 type:complete len:427 (-) Transcript_10959:1225-2505(-)